MTLPFSKYQGTGNDFILIDNRSGRFKKDPGFIHFLCHRRFGIGADGLILLENSSVAVFKMVYFNSDGNESTFCGNGGRCIVAFAHALGLINPGVEIEFEAKDGLHKAQLEGNSVNLRMKDVSAIDSGDLYFVVDTGSPHYVTWVDSVDSIDVPVEGARIRNSPMFKKNGINVNFIEKGKDGIRVRTFERGVEDETLSCGTGVTASALVAALSGFSSPVKVETPGGNLEVRFNQNMISFSDISLIGLATLVFSGQINQLDGPNQAATGF